MTEALKEVSDLNFDEQVLLAGRPVLVNFWAPWCGPCKALGPLIEGLADLYGDRMEFFKMNVDENPLTPAKYGIKAIPTLVIFRDGKPVDVTTGLCSRAKLENAIQGAIEGAPAKTPFVIQ